MELVLKLPKGKPPFIGILFQSATEAEKLNSDLVVDHRYLNYKIIFEIIADHLNIRLICEELVTVRFYNHVVYDPEKLKSWLYVLKTGKTTSVNFSHLILKDNKHTLVKAYQQKIYFVLKVANCKVLTK